MLKLLLAVVLLAAAGTIYITHKADIDSYYQFAFSEAADGPSTSTITEQQVAPSIAPEDRTQPTPGFEEREAPMGKPAVISNPSKDYVFQNMNPDGSPVAFSPCRPVHYVVRTQHMPEGGLKMLQEILQEVSNVTGLVFVYDGPTQENPSKDRQGYQPALYGDRWAPILFAWSDPKETPGLKSDVIGEATTYQLVRSTGFATYVTGQVVLDTTREASLRAQYGPEVLAGVVRHEVGHLVGMGHSGDRDEIMFPETNSGITDYMAGDLTGLARLGTGKCAKDV